MEMFFGSVDWGFVSESLEMETEVLPMLKELGVEDVEGFFTSLIAMALANKSLVKKALKESKV